MPVNASKTALVWFFFLMTSVLISGCSYVPEVDERLATDTPCTALCWNNITPGVSTEDDVRRQLEDSSLLQGGCSVNRSLTEREGVPLTVLSWQSPSGKGNWVYLRDDQVLWIYAGLERELTLGEIIDEYGPPESVYATLIRTGYLRYHINVDYPSQGMGFSTSLHPCDPDNVNCEDSMMLSEDVVMTRAIYFAPTSLEGMYSEVLLLPPDRVEHHLTNHQEWNGFGHIKVAR